MIDTYITYCTWFASHYGRPFTATREEWNHWCKATDFTPNSPSDIDFDHAKEREGDAQ